MSCWPRFYPIAASAAGVCMLAAAGARLVQLRIKQADPGTIGRQIRMALDGCRARGTQLVINDHWQAALDEGADFVHLGQQDLQQADLARLRRRRVRLGISTHDHAELARALELAPDYVALGPIYPTTLKAMPWAPQGLARLGEWKRRVDPRPLVAIGGITLARAPGCLAAGADSVAAVSDVMARPDPAAHAAAWVAAIEVRA